MRQLLIEHQYLGPIRYFATILAYDQVYIEAKEHFVKRTYRNRCYLPGSNGIQILSIPLEKNKKRISMDAVRIVYAEEWQKNHWQTIVSIYNRSPYFEYYYEDFEKVYKTQYDTLFEFIEALNRIIFDVLDVKPKIGFTSEYEKEVEGTDKRSHIMPSKELIIKDDNYKGVDYYQVFQDRTGFIEEMSILDLIFCEGPNAGYLLHQAYSFD